jgi:hypothetical protein
MKQVYLTESLQEAELLRVSLRREGIESTLENEFSATPLPLIISVSEDDEAGALRVIRAYLAQNNLRP